MIRSEVNCFVPNPVTEIVFSDWFLFLKALPKTTDEITIPKEAIDAMITGVFFIVIILGKDNKFISENYIENKYFEPKSMKFL